MKVNVTAKHIRKGKRSQPCHCPIALALKEQLHKEVEVGPYDMFFLYRKKIAGEAKTPDSAYYFIRAFDKGHKVKPFTFEVSFRAMRS